MTNNPLLNYKPGVTLDTPVPVTLAAADWAIFMAWFSTQNNTDGIHHIVFGAMSPQIAEALFTADSLRTVEAYANGVNYSTSPSTLDDLLVPDTDVMGEVWTIRCRVCGSKDEYPGGYDGPMTCGHNVGRTVDEKRPVEKE